MSISTVFDVRCDGKDCPMWAERAGSTISPSDARKRARITGWGRRKVEDQVVDLCPACLAKLGPTRGHR